MQENDDDDILLELFLCINGLEIVEKSLCLQVKTAFDFFQCLFLHELHH